MAQQNPNNYKGECSEEYDIKANKSRISLTLIIPFLQPELRYFHIKIKNPSQLEVIFHKFVQPHNILEQVYNCCNLAREGWWRDRIISALLEQNNLPSLDQYIQTLPEAEVDIYDCPACCIISPVIGGVMNIDLTP